jgi:hypothetical protein
MLIQCTFTDQTTLLAQKGCDILEYECIHPPFLVIDLTLVAGPWILTEGTDYMNSAASLISTLQGNILIELVTIDYLTFIGLRRALQLNQIRKWCQQPKIKYLLIHWLSHVEVCPASISEAPVALGQTPCLPRESRARYHQGKWHDDIRIWSLSSRG